MQNENSEAVAEYGDRSVAMTKEASAENLQKISELWDKFVPSLQVQEKSTVQNANLAREIGIHLMTLCGHDVMKQSFWVLNCQGKVPFDFETAKVFMGVARRLAKKAKTISDAAPFVQMILFAGGNLELPERTEPQMASSMPLIEVCLSKIDELREKFGKAFRDRPLDTWTVPAMDRYLSDTRWIQEDREKIMRLRQSKQ